MICTVMFKRFASSSRLSSIFQEKAGAVVSYTEAKPPKPDGLTGVFITV